MRLSLVLLLKLQAREAFLKKMIISEGGGGGGGGGVFVCLFGVFALFFVAAVSLGVSLFFVCLLVCFGWGGGGG